MVAMCDINTYCISDGLQPYHSDYTYTTPQKLSRVTHKQINTYTHMHKEYVCMSMSKKDYTENVVSRQVGVVKQVKLWRHSLREWPEMAFCNMYHCGCFRSNKVSKIFIWVWGKTWGQWQNSFKNVMFSLEQGLPNSCVIVMIYWNFSFSTMWLTKSHPAGGFLYTVISCLISRNNFSKTWLGNKKKIFKDIS